MIIVSNAALAKIAVRPPMDQSIEDDAQTFA